MQQACPTLMLMHAKETLAKSFGMSAGDTLVIRFGVSFGASMAPGSIPSRQWRRAVLDASCKQLQNPGSSIACWTETTRGKCARNERRRGRRGGRGGGSGARLGKVSLKRPFHFRNAHNAPEAESIANWLFHRTHLVYYTA